MGIMVAEGGSGGGGPEWTVIGGAIVAIATAAAGIIAGMRGAFKQRGDDRSTLQIEVERAQLGRDVAATANASLTLESVFRLVNELQEEVARKSDEIERIYRVCQETKSLLLVRIGEMESEIRALKKNTYELEERIRDLRIQLHKQPPTT